MLSWENNNNKITLYHGTNNPDIIPEYGKGKSLNDYGKGFYTTTNEELAKEWTMNKFVGDNVLNRYCTTFELTYTGLRVLNLDDHEPVHWIATLIKYRGINTNPLKSDLINRSDLTSKKIHDFVSKFAINTEDFDCIKGYRADDGYYNYIRSFLDDILTVDEIAHIMRTGESGEQVCIKSRKAFSNIKNIGCSKVPLNYSLLYDRRLNKANKEVNNVIKLKKNKLYSNEPQAVEGTFSYYVNLTY